ncbi:cytochrome P450 [Nemania diffusa]|nr:cytochrome P450 [Nemania diffusa]
MESIAVECPMPLNSSFDIVNRSVAFSSHHNAAQSYRNLSLLTHILIPIFLVPGIILTITYLFTWGRFYLTSGLSYRFLGNEPPKLPYWLPWVGNAVSMVTDPHKFYEQTLSKRPEKGPVTMRLGPITMYLIMGADNIQAIFKNSRHLSFEFMQLRIAQMVKGLPLTDAEKLGLDDSGTGSVPLSDLPQEARIWHKLHGIYLSNLTERSAVDFLTNKFVEEFSKQLESVPWACGNDLTSTSTGIYAFLQQFQFNASTVTLVGPRILRLGKQVSDRHRQIPFASTFWEYDAAFMTLLQGMPRFMCRKGWAARDHTLEVTKAWLREATEAATSMPDTDADWDENFGHRLVRERNAALVDYGISFEGRAAMHMGLIWAINANAIPMTAYMLIEMVQDPRLLERVRDEIEAAAVFPGKSLSGRTSLDKIDIAALTKLPLLNSVYSECLRLRSSIPISRRLRQDIDVHGYTLKKGNFILAPSWLSHVDESVWNQDASSGLSSSQPHPGAREFWAERFLHMEATKTKIKLGDYCPYGGGSVICPGRFFAKHEILAAVAMVIIRFELQFERYSFLDGTTPSHRGPGMEKAECRGIVSLDRDVIVKMRKRSLDRD